MEKEPKWWENAVFYQIYPRSFADSNNDGIGDIPGIIGKLDYLKELGVDAIWLSPVYKSPNKDYGYDISDYCDINPEYGTLGDMKQLFSEAKKRDIRIVMDLVVNHTSDQHPWFLKSKDVNSPYHDYYIWQPGKAGKNGKIEPPNNWDSMFIGSAWGYEKSNNLFFLHLFTPEQPDLNWCNPKVLEEVENIMRFWLDLGAAGFRCDVINCIWKDSLADGKKTKYITGKEFYLSRPGCHQILKQINRDVLAPAEAFTVGETTQVKLEDAVQFTHGELTMVFPFDHTSVDQGSVPIFKKKYRPQKMIAALDKWQTHVDWNPIFFENHDIPRSVSRFGDDGKLRNESAKMLATILLTLRGTPFIFEGEEIGMRNVPFKNVKQMKDVTAYNIYNLLTKQYLLPKPIVFKLIMNIARDHARVPMAWDASLNGGFSLTEPWLMASPDFDKINVKTDTNNLNGIFNYYRELIALRKATPALCLGTYTKVDADSEVYAYYREYEKSKYLVIANMGSKTRKQPYHQGKLMMANYLDSSIANKKIRPYESLIIKIK
ncbi:MAG: alpha-amylase family glycosyl hydrolase [Bacilli bacterium]|jgi:oligo-1,6-glucosidase|nr:alpha-amylase family glycosyl hydrolase [Bacilli bacterium]